MAKHKFEIEIEAVTETEATSKLKAAVILMQKLRPNEITKLAEVVKNDPIKTAFAKKALGL
jgi:nicotinate-nucleotide pyrophosphorylase